MNVCISIPVCVPLHAPYPTLPHTAYPPPTWPFHLTKPWDGPQVNFCAGNQAALRTSALRFLSLNAALPCPVSMPLHAPHLRSAYPQYSPAPHVLTAACPALQYYQNPWDLEPSYRAAGWAAVCTSPLHFYPYRTAIHKALRKACCVLRRCSSHVHAQEGLLGGPPPSEPSQTPCLPFH